LVRANWANNAEGRALSAGVLGEYVGAAAGRPGGTLDLCVGVNKVLALLAIPIREAPRLRFRQMREKAPLTWSALTGVPSLWRQDGSPSAIWLHFNPDARNSSKDAKLCAMCRSSGGHWLAGKRAEASRAFSTLVVLIDWAMASRTLFRLKLRLT
jgi:hypothetical protein